MWISKAGLAKPEGEDLEVREWVFQGGRTEDKWRKAVKAWKKEANGLKIFFSLLYERAND